MVDESLVDDLMEVESYEILSGLFLSVRVLAIVVATTRIQSIRSK